MEVKINKETDQNIVFIIGRLDTLNAGELQKEIEPLLEESKTLIFDCKDMEYISSSGLRVMLSTHKTMKAKNSKLILRNINKEVLSVIKLTGFTNFLNIE